MSTQEATGTRWIDAARYVLEHKSFVMVEDDGTWHPPTAKDWNALDSEGEFAEHMGIEPTETSGMVLDTFTASMLVQIYDAVNDENREKLGAMSLERAVDIGWKLVKRAS